MEKRCAGPCGETKPLDDFHKRAKSKDGRQTWCKACMKARRINQPANPKTQRAWALKRLYGLTVEQWDAMLIAQAGRCDLCTEPMKSPHVDHSHLTGKVRSLLCLRCNTMLGHVERLGLKYIERYILRETVCPVMPLEVIPEPFEAFYRSFLSSSYN